MAIRGIITVIPSRTHVGSARSRAHTAASQYGMRAWLTQRRRCQAVAHRTRRPQSVGKVLLAWPDGCMYSKWQRTSVYFMNARFMRISALSVAGSTNDHHFELVVYGTSMYVQYGTMVLTFDVVIRGNTMVNIPLLVPLPVHYHTTPRRGASPPPTDYHYSYIPAW